MLYLIGTAGLELKQGSTSYEVVTTPPPAPEDEEEAAAFDPSIAAAALPF